MTGMTRAVFVSYASQDAEAAHRICEALRAAGIEVWFDQSELRGGDAWDRQITKQIRECALFVAVISANTEARDEGYFRREWRIAVDRTRDFADDKAFLLPIVVDATPDSSARVPDRFREVQWTRLPHGESSPAFVERVARLLAPSASSAQAPGTRPLRAAPTRSSERPREPAAAPVARPQPRATWTKALLLAILLAVLAAGYVGWQQVRGSKPSTATTTGAPERPTNGVVEQSVAVLPFVNMSSDKEQEYFSDGLSEELIDMLSKVPDLRVPARTSSFYFKGRNETIETIAKQLKVANLLEGSVRKAGDRLRITAQLIRADNGFHLWSETYDRDTKDVFKVQDEIAAAVVEALKVKLAPGQQAASSHRTSNTEAYNEYLLGRQFFNQSEMDAMRRSIDAYKRAIALDPNYAAAYAGLAFSESYLADLTGDAAGLDRAKAAAEKAIALAPAEADGYAARGYLRYVYNWDWTGGQADLEKALAIDPGNSTAQRRYGDLLVCLGRPTEGLEALKRAVALDPLSARFWGVLGSTLTSVRDYRGAHEALRRALEISPESSYTLNDLATLLLLEGKPAEALDKARKNEMEAFRLTDVASAEHSLGHREESQRALEEAIAKTAKEAAYQIAEVFAWRGEKDQAFEWLERAYRQRDGGLISIKFDPLLASLRGDQRYKALVRKLNLPQ